MQRRTSPQPIKLMELIMLMETISKCQHPFKCAKITKRDRSNLILIKEESLSLMEYLSKTVEHHHHIHLVYRHRALPYP